MRQISGPSITLATLFGIPVKVHWTFGLLVLFVGYIASSNGLSLVELGIFSSYLFCLFLFVIMHEYGHALAAKKYGIDTRDIIISPIGGVARLESMPENPTHELVVALAGPMVNVIWYIGLFVVQLIIGGTLLPSVSDLALTASLPDFIHLMMLINGTLVVFNMIPAFPMDGGRVLRACITMLTKDRVKATRIASAIGQIIAVGFIAYGSYLGHYALVFIGIFVIITARQEYRHIKIQHRLLHTYLGDIARSDFPLLRQDDMINDLLQLKIERSYLVLDDQSQVIGVIPPIVLNSLDHKETSVLRADHYMLTSIGRLPHDMNLMSAFHAMNVYGWVVSSITDDQQQIQGWVSREMINEQLQRKD